MSAPLITILTVNDPVVMRIHGPLAEEIGLDESILLLQLEYLIRDRSNKTPHEHDGRLWYYCTLAQLKAEYFKWWSISTISRIIKRLEAAELIVTGNYNATGYDRTQWFALNEVGLRRLTSIDLRIAILQNEKSNQAECKMDLAKLQNRSCGDDTTIPETTTKTTTQTTTTTNPPAQPAPAGGGGAGAPGGGGVASQTNEGEPSKPEPPTLTEKFLKSVGIKNKTKRQALRNVPLEVAQREWAALAGRQLADPAAVLASVLTDWEPGAAAGPPAVDRTAQRAAEDQRLRDRINDLTAQLAITTNRRMRSEMESELRDLEIKSRTLLAVGGAR